MLRCIEAVQHKGMREPERLVGLVATVCRRYISAEYSRRAMERETINVEMIQIPAVGPDINEALGRSRVLAAATTALAELSEKEREILVRFYIKDQDKEQICAAMQLDSVQFRNLKHRAKQKVGERGRRILHSRLPLPFPQPTSGRVAAILG
jgi:RNA polymerase sigma-70 factor (ECF subfamily)